MVGWIPPSVPPGAGGRLGISDIGHRRHGPRAFPSSALAPAAIRAVGGTIQADAWTAVSDITFKDDSRIPNIR